SGNKSISVSAPVPRRRVVSFIMQSRWSRRRRLFVLAPMWMTILVACRQLVGLDDIPAVTPPDELDGGTDADAESPDDAADAGSPFSVIHSAVQGETLYGIWGNS